MNLRELYYSLPPSLRFFSRKLYYFPKDLIASLTGKRGKYQPKEGDIYTGGRFIEEGKYHLFALKKFIGLKPSDDVLDIGSGIGRTAIQLIEYLEPQSRYEGFDVVKKGVDWCNSKIKKDYPNFNFTYVPLNNDLYNNSAAQASEFTFPYKDQTFDKVYLFSVFTHMKVGEIDHYLSEISRVLKPKGQCLATFFVYNNQTESELVEIEGFNFPVKREGYRLMNEQVESANIALAEQTLKGMRSSKSIKMKKIINGYWKNSVAKNDENNFQDLVIFEKE